METRTIYLTSYHEDFCRDIAPNTRFQMQKHTSKGKGIMISSQKNKKREIPSSKTPLLKIEVHIDEIEAMSIDYSVKSPFIEKYVNHLITLQTQELNTSPEGLVIKYCREGYCYIPTMTERIPNTI